MSEQASLIYALQTKKFRAFRMLLNNPDIDFSQEDEYGLTVLGLANFYQVRNEKKEEKDQVNWDELISEILKIIKERKLLLQEQSMAIAKEFGYALTYLNKCLVKGFSINN